MTIKQKCVNYSGVYEKQISKIYSIAPSFDPCSPAGRPRVRTNGYRSLVRVAVSFLGVLTEKLANMSAKPLSPADVQQLESLVECTNKLITMNEFLLEMDSASENGELFPTRPDLALDERAAALSTRLATMDFSCLLGGLCGFHFTRDCRRLAKAVLMASAYHMDVYDDASCGERLRRIVSAVLFGARRLTDPDALARKISAKMKNQPVELCQSYNLAERTLLRSDKFLAIRRRRDTGAGVKTNCVINIPPERMKIQNTQGAFFQVPIPSSHRGPNHSVQVRLISPFRTPDMIGSCLCTPSSSSGIRQCSSCKIVPESDCILFHLHGGGFVSQTSKSHTSYLKRWSRDLGVPILSVDYSMAPESPFPRAVEEVLFAYCWMRNNFRLLGSTGKKVIVCGDSAGGNLSAGLVAQCVQLSLPKPDHLALFYPSLLCQMYPSPSRILSFLDPIVSFPCLLRCLNAYTDQHYKESCPRTFDQELASCKTISDPLISPLLTPKEIIGLFPPSLLVTSDVDPCLDETIAFFNKLTDEGVYVDLQVLRGLPHGFLCLGDLSKDCRASTDFIAEKLRDIILA